MLGWFFPSPAWAVVFGLLVALVIGDLLLTAANLGDPRRWSRLAGEWNRTHAVAPESNALDDYVQASRGFGACGRFGRPHPEALISREELEWIKELDEQAWSAAPPPELAGVLARLTGALSLLEQGARKPHCWEPLDRENHWNDGAIQDLLALQYAAQWWRLQAREKARSGDFKGAADDLLGCFRFARHLQEKAHQCLFNCNGMVVEEYAMAGIERVVLDLNPPADFLAGLSDGLASAGDLSVPPCFDTELLQGQGSVEYCFTPQEWHDWLALGPLSLKTSLKREREVVEACRRIAMEPLDSPGRLDRFDRTVKEGGRAARLCVPSIRNMTDVLRETRMRSVGTRLLCRVELHHRKTGSYPETLRAVGEEPDPLTGKPFVYKRTPEGGFLLYSLGRNGKDDGGDESRLKDKRGRAYGWPQDDRIGQPARPSRPMVFKKAETRAKPAPPPKAP